VSEEREDRRDAIDEARQDAVWEQPDPEEYQEGSGSRGTRTRRRR